MGERFLMEHYPEALLVRTSWLFGKEGNDFVKKMIELMDEKERISVVNDQRGRPTYADDLAEAVLSILDESGIYHFANEGETTWHGFAESIQKKLKEKKISVVNRLIPSLVKSLEQKQNVLHLPCY